MPDSDDLLQLFGEVQAKHSQAIVEFKEDEDLIRGEFGRHIIPADTEDKGLEVTKPPTAYNAVENAADHILTNPRILVPARPTDEDHEQEKDRARKRQQFLEMFWQRTSEEHGDPLARGVKSLIKGKVVFKKVIDWNLLPDADTDDYARQVQRVTGTKFVWHVEAVPKETVFEDTVRPHDPQYVFESYRIPVIEAIRRFPSVREQLSGRGNLETVDYIEYWSKPMGSDRGKFVQWIDTERVHEGINPYSWESPISTEEKPDYEGYVPYAIGDPGWGDVDADAKPEDRYWSIVRPIRSVAVAEARMLTSMEAWMRLYVWPILLASGFPASQEFKVGPGQVWKKTIDQAMEVLKWGEMPLSLLQGMQRVNEYADQASKFGVLGGQAQSGVDTATEADQHLRNAATKLSGPVRTLRRLISRMNTWVLMDVEKVLESPVTIWGASSTSDAAITLSPSDIDGAYFTQVELDTSDEAVLSTRMLRMWADIAQRMPVPASFVLQQGGVTNPDDLMDEWEIEQLERSPQAQQIKTQLMLMRVAEEHPEVEQILAAFMASLMQPQKPQDGAQQGSQPQADQMGNPIEQARREARDEAIEAQPELAYQ